jgi:hypothetical protein
MEVGCLKTLYSRTITQKNVKLVRRICLYVSTKLGDLLDDLVVVGGLVPSLLIPDESLPAGEDVHIGTMDLDLGLCWRSSIKNDMRILPKGFTDRVLNRMRTRKAILRYNDGRFTPPLV